MRENRRQRKKKKKKEKNPFQETITKHNNCNQTTQGENSVEKQRGKSRGMFMGSHLCAATCDAV